MKNAKKSIILLATVLSFGMYACQKDGLTEEEALKLSQTTSVINDSLTNAKVEYSVTLLDASTSLLKSASTNTFLNSTVTITQNGTILTTKVDTTGGIATFKNLRKGSANVSIKCPGYYDVDFVVSLATGSSQVSNLIAMLPNTTNQFSTLSGKVTYEKDLTNLTPENAANVNVVAMIDPSSDLLSKMTTNTNITNISYGDISLSAITDKEGNYSIKVPVSQNELKYTVRVADFSVYQKILLHNLNGVETNKVDTIPTIFGFVNGASPSTVPSTSDVPVAIIAIDAPNYTYTQATATAVVDNPNGISDINVTNVGANYAQGTYSVNIDGQIITDNSSSTYLNPAVALFYVNSNGRVSKVDITNQGTNYSNNDGSNITLPYVLNNNNATVKVTSVDANNKITGAIVTNGGSYTTQNVTLVLSNGTGSGAVLTPANWYWNGNSWSFSSVTITSGGTGNYTTASTFTGSVPGSSNQMTGKLHLTKGVISGFNIINQGSNYIASYVDVVITDATGTGATAVAALTSDGRLKNITTSNSGSGYTSPTVTIVNRYQPRQAKANYIYYNNTSNGVITSVSLQDCGQGYFTVPNVTIIPTSNIGSGASIKATINGGQITSLSIVNGGSGYSAMNTALKGSSPTVNDMVITTPVTVKFGTNAVMNIYLGTGYRTIK